MIPSRELDALVAEKVLGKKLDLRTDSHCVPVGHVLPEHVRPYSTDIATAWEVVEKVGLVWRGFHFGLFWSSYYEDYRDAQWRAGWFEWEYTGPEDRAVGYSLSAPHAICLAALRAVGVTLPLDEASR